RLLRAVPADDAAEVIGTTGIAACLDHLEQAARAQPRMLGELLDDEWHERICERGPRRNRLRRHARLSQHTLHRGVVHAELSSDRPDSPLLGMEEALNLRFGFFGDHGFTSGSGRRATRRARSSPSNVPAPPALTARPG